MTWAGERGKHFCSFQSPEMFFLLTLPFIERRYGKGASRYEQTWSTRYLHPEYRSNPLTLNNLTRRPARFLKPSLKIGHLDFVIYPNVCD